MQTGRVVAVQSEAAFGSGYVIGRRLILTSAHVVPAIGQPVQVYGLTGGGPHLGTVRWRGTPGGRDDAALVDVSDPGWREPAGGPLRWGRVCTNRPDIPCQTWGFPDWAGTIDNHPEAWQATGTLNPGSAYVSDRYVLGLHTQPPQPQEGTVSPWSGLSGAAMFCGPLLAGVMTADKADGQHGYLTAVPVTVLLQDPQFRATIEGNGLSTVTLEPVEAEHLGEYEPGIGGSVAALLRARAEVVAFRGRDQVMADLRAWATRPGFATWLLYGRGGEGKTRVAQELCRRLTELRWATVWLSRTAPIDELSVFTDAAVPMIIVVDYAETRDSVQVAELLRAGARHSGDSPLRVLLLARTSGRWWRELKAMDRHVEAVLETAPAVELPRLESQPSGRVEAYRHAVEDLSRVLAAMPGHERHDWSRSAKRVVEDRGDLGRRSTALTLHMTALADLLDDHAGSANLIASTVEGRLLDHERRLWRKSAATWPAIATLDLSTLEDAVAVATLFGAADDGQADVLLERLPSLEGRPRDCRSSLREWIAGVYPSSDDGTWGGLQPDRLAEWFIGDRLLKDPGFIEPLVEVAERAQLEQLLTVYTRAAGHPAIDGRLDEPLIELCLRHRPTLYPVVVAVSNYTETPGPLRKVLPRMLDDSTLTFTDLLDMTKAVPSTSHSLAQFAGDLFQLLVDEAGRRLAAADTSVTEAQLATLYNTLAGWRSDNGDHEQAAEAARQSVSMRRSADNGSIPSLRALASSLNNLSVCLGKLDRRQPALDAIEEAHGIYRMLNDAEPDIHLADLAMSSDNLANRLRAHGRHEQALDASQQAVTAARDLNRKDTEYNLPILAAALNNHSVHLSDAGKHDQALAAIQETVIAYEQLAADSPDLHQPNLAMALSNLANRLSRTGRPTEAATVAEQAVRVYRRLAEHRPLLFRPQLACALHNLVTHVARLGGTHQAVALAEETVAAYRRLTDERPGTFLPELAAALYNYAGQLGRSGQYEAALAAVEESAAIQRDQPGGSPEAAQEMLHWLRTVVAASTDP